MLESRLPLTLTHGLTSLSVRTNAPSQFLQDRFPRHLSAVTFGEGPSHLLHLLQDAQATYLHGAVGQGIAEAAEKAEIGDARKLAGVKMSAVLVQQQWSLELRLVRVSRLTLRSLAQKRAAMIRVE
jgi:hypothetical protein